ncbi:MAG: hypothetical protein ACJASY_003716 [Halioglobus sp.]|jgi:hypothetical protein
MGEFVLIAGVLLVGISLYLAVRPQAMLALIEQSLTTRWLFLVALLRLLLGAALLASASQVRFSEEVAVIGWIAALSGMVLVAIPLQVWDRLNDRVKAFPTLSLRVWPLAGLALGGFLLFAYFS